MSDAKDTRIRCETCKFLDFKHCHYNPPMFDIKSRIKFYPQVELYDWCGKHELKEG